jgi:hypothetical protein
VFVCVYPGKQSKLGDQQLQVQSLNVVPMLGAPMGAMQVCVCVCVWWSMIILIRMRLCLLHTCAQAMQQMPAQLAPIRQMHPLGMPNSNMGMPQFPPMPSQRIIGMPNFYMGLPPFPQMATNSFGASLINPQMNPHMNPQVSPRYTMPRCTACTLFYTHAVLHTHTHAVLYTHIYTDEPSNAPSSKPMHKSCILLY